MFSKCTIIYFFEFEFSKKKTLDDVGEDNLKGNRVATTWYLNPNYKYELYSDLLLITKLNIVWYKVIEVE